MVALFEDIALYSTDMLNNRNMRNKVPLEAVLFFFQNRRDAFITFNFIPLNLDGASINSLVSACFYYAVSEFLLLRASHPKVKTIFSLLFLQPLHYLT